MFDEEEITSTVLLPAPTWIFYASRHYHSLQTLPRTVVLNDFFTNTPTIYDPTIVGANGYLCTITMLFDRVIRFRQDCERRSVIPFLAGVAAGQGSDLGLRMSDIERSVHEWFDRLPEQAKHFDRGVYPDETASIAWTKWLPEWSDETYDWGIDLVVYHVVMITLHGPSYNLMQIGKQLVPASGPFGSVGSGLASDFPNSLTFDNLLESWQNSPSFDVALHHAEMGISVLEEMTAHVPPERRRDTPFFGYSLCQLGLITLLAARQTTLADATGYAGMAPAASCPSQARTMQPLSSKGLPLSTLPSLSKALQTRAAVPIAVLAHQVERFPASNTGQKLLLEMMTEIAGGEVTLSILAELREQGSVDAGASFGQAMARNLVQRAMGKSAEEVLALPGKCAGIMMTEGC
ncbi:hypothetical protein BDK51DRAFT_47918 [Blyttiomyces helicus]|uniref:Uncharacterized protein n=1 Tax=Blyttiomyces helicus TaxID=388810 RepID=A0A4P9WCN7_9FUNG|nr:hypothetical protein BDK51DRAFT_47918 [Blyttiomyces helicus]|eukprot:RKO88660.1 hypothetical protein BDK51DRAFT_47918 [Blyttiomyces helicus]